MGGYQHIPEANKLLQLVNVCDRSHIFKVIHLSLFNKILFSQAKILAETFRI